MRNKMKKTSHFWKEWRMKVRSGPPDSKATPIKQKSAKIRTSRSERDSWTRRKRRDCGKIFFVFSFCKNERTLKSDFDWRRADQIGRPMSIQLGYEFESTSSVQLIHTFPRPEMNYSRDATVIWSTCGPKWKITIDRSIKANQIKSKPIIFRFVRSIAGQPVLVSARVCEIFFFVFFFFDDCRFKFDWDGLLPKTTKNNFGCQDRSI